MKTLTTSCAAIAALLALAPAAHAGCTPDSPGNDEAVTCTGTESEGISDGSKRLTLTVETGALVRGEPGEDAIKMRDDDNRILNNGTIQGDDEAIVGGNRLQVTNNGRITAGDKAIVGETEDEVLVDGDEERIKSLDMVIVNNEGASITAGDDAINGGANLTVTNHGTINAGDKGIQAEDVNGDKVRVIVTNSAGGIIDTVDESIEGGDDARVTNHGLITSSEDDAINLGERAVIENHGVIRNTGGAQDAIDLDSATITNFSGAVIESLSDGAIDFDESSTTARIYNRGGTIRGLTYGILVETDPAEGANVAAQIIENSGLIEGGSYALFLGAGEDSYRHKSGGALRGAADFGADDDSFYFEDVLTGLFADGAVMEGGAGFDTMSFLSYALADLTEVVQHTGFTGLFFGSASVNVNGWESFAFSDQTVAAADLAAPPAVPLPAAAWLFLTGLGAFVGLRRFA